MGEGFLRAYHALPDPLRAIPVFVRGWQLRRWRYGAETESLVEAALERETWSAGRWRAWSEERLAYVLHRAATRVPYYREYWSARRRRGDRASWERIEHWPVLEKEAVRARPQAFVADDCAPSRMFRLSTSGTTGTPLKIFESRATVRARYALFEARCRRWHGVTSRDRWAVLGGQLVVPVSQRRPPFWVWNAPLRQLYMSSYHLAPDTVAAYLDAWVRYGVVYVEGYTSALYVLAQEALRLERFVPSLRLALTNAEPVYPYQREAIVRAFAAAVRETYGMAEMVAAASECEAGTLHAWPEVGWVELVADPDASDGTGELVCTSLLNADMPLVRYRVGDRASLAPPGAACPCGRGLPVFHRLEGRSDDILVLPDGRRVGRLDPVFKADLPIREAQVVQETVWDVRVRVVAAPGFEDEHAEAIARRLRDRLGEVRVMVERVPELPRSANGKFRAVVSRVSGGQGAGAGPARGGGGA